MADKFRRKAILAKIESVYGTDPTPTGAANAILAKDVEIEPMAGESEQRNLVLPWLGNDENIPVGVHRRVRFKVEMASAGAAGTAPAWGPLLRGSGFAQTIDAGVDVEYDPVSELEESLTIYMHQGGTLHKLLGARGSVAIELEPKRIPHLAFDFVGLFVAATATALPDPDYSAFEIPKPAGFVNTPTFTLHGYAARLDRLNINLAIDAQYRELVGGESVEIVDRAPAGTIGIEAPPLGTKDFFAAAKDVTLGALQLVHGVGAGNIVQIDAPKVQIGSPSYRESQGIAMLDLPVSLVPDAGDDEIKITVK